MYQQNRSQLSTLRFKNMIITSFNSDAIAFLDDVVHGRPAEMPRNQSVRIREDGREGYVDLPLEKAVIRLRPSGRPRVATVELRQYQGFTNIVVSIDGKFCHYFPTNAPAEPWLVKLAVFLGVDEDTLAVMRGEKTTEAVEPELKEAAEPAETPAEAPVGVVGEDGHHAEEVAVVVDTASPKKGKRGGDSEKKEG